MNLKSNLQIVVFILAVLVSCSEPKNEAADTKEGSKSFKALPVSTEFDVVILNGRVMDPETNFDAIRNVGIKDGRIALITEERYFRKRNHRCDRSCGCPRIYGHALALAKTCGL
jgi:hypothetical protein